MSKLVEDLTSKALRNGKAVRGPWEVEATGYDDPVAPTKVRLYHYGHLLAFYNGGQFEATPRPGFDFSMSDAEGIGSFASALGVDRVKVAREMLEGNVRQRAYGTNRQGEGDFSRRRPT
jgi:hypothetical protein